MATEWLLRHRTMPVGFNTTTDNATAGQTLSCDDMGDAGTVGDLLYLLYAWDDEYECYRLVEQA